MKSNFFPGAEYKICNNILHLAQLVCSEFFVVQYLKEQKDPVMEEVLLETENKLARGRMDLPPSLCLAALRGDDLLLHQLLKGGLDPNEVDNSGRSALVCRVALLLSTT